MELRVLNYFLVVAREENITRAASILHITQPTLSRQLVQLEEELGVKLYQRSKHRIILTEEGNLLRRRAQEILQLTEKTKLELVEADENIVGEISIGCGELLSMEKIGDLIYEFRKIHPLVNFHIISGMNDFIKEQIEQGLMDFGLLIQPVEIEKYQFVRMTQQERWGILVKETHSLAKKKNVTPVDLFGRELIVTDSNSIQNELASWFNQNDAELKIVSTYTLLNNAAILVNSGVGIALCLELHVTYPHLKFIPFEPDLTLQSVLAWKANQVYSEATRAFIEFVKNA
ncbi:LysR family transcriptional regulator [Enterococcus sp. HY326]|uniref:LysR family transcriptional regulator n=1 Tax=Enterococcus sp. HY326 TaxID=2971265 RepID=UPI00223F28BD|nr:LysR family transcriptional regulator [Enterococcus sp. HY326]